MVAYSFSDAYTAFAFFTLYRHSFSENELINYVSLNIQFVSRLFRDKSVYPFIVLIHIMDVLFKNTIINNCGSLSFFFSSLTED